VHTATFAGAPLAASAAIATLDVLGKERLPRRSADLGARYLEELRQQLSPVAGVRELRGQGLMVGIDLGERPGIAARAMRRLLERGYITSTGGGQREVLVLTPPLNIAEDVLLASASVLAEQIAGLT